MSEPSRYVVGLDLGTTNCAVAYVDTKEFDGDEPPIRSLPLTQLIKPGESSAEPLLPSFLYLPAEGEFIPAQLALPWGKDRSDVIGRFAREHGATIPDRLISSAKSWLCHPGIDRRGAVLPWTAAAEVSKLSPIEAQTRLLKHLREAWNHDVAGKDKSARLEQQEIVLTVPASFDAVARELTLEAARLAGLERVTLFEEPQAAFYAWIHQNGAHWRRQVQPRDVALVVDIGGGTTDFTLIGVGQEQGELTLERIAVGDHLLLGGDNMDLALAHAAAQQLKEAGHRIETAQFLALGHQARIAKEKLLENPKLKSQPIALLGRGRKVVGGALKTELERATVERVLVESFFPKVGRDAQPAVASALGLRELGLEYTADAAVTKHLAAFLDRHQNSIKEFRESKAPSLPTALLFNGGVFHASALRQRILDVLASWDASSTVKELKGDGNRADESLDRAVAIGAAYYGMVRRGKGVRIRGGVARSYYVGVEIAMPAVPGVRPPMKALCVAPRGMEEGTEVELPAREFGLAVGQPAEFRFLGSTNRPQDAVGEMIDDWENSLEELAPIRVTLPASKEHSSGAVVPVRLLTKVTEVGALEIWFRSRDGADQWKLEFDVRERES